RAGARGSLPPALPRPHRERGARRTRRAPPFFFRALCAFRPSPAGLGDPRQFAAVGHLAEADPGQPRLAQVAARAAVPRVPVAVPGGAGVARLAVQLADGGGALLGGAVRVGDDPLELGAALGVARRDAGALLVLDDLALLGHGSDLLPAGADVGDDALDAEPVDHLHPLGADPQPDPAVLRGQPVALALDVGVEAAAGAPVGVRDGVAERRPPPGDLADAGHGAPLGSVLLTRLRYTGMITVFTRSRRAPRRPPGTAAPGPRSRRRPPPPRTRRRPARPGAPPPPAPGARSPPSPRRSPPPPSPRRSPPPCP